MIWLFSSSPLTDDLTTSVIFVITSSHSCGVAEQIVSSVLFYQYTVVTRDDSSATRTDAEGQTCTKPQTTLPYPANERWRRLCVSASTFRDPFIKIALNRLSFVNEDFSSEYRSIDYRAWTPPNPHLHHPVHHPPPATASRHQNGSSPAAVQDKCLHSRKPNLTSIHRDRKKKLFLQ